MKAKSHRALARYLIDSYLDHQPRLKTWAFLLGCIQPDQNPTTYLKGSLREQWLRGHNWDNAKNYMQRIAARLERRKRLRLLDYYTLGKLVHYTTDAFTFAHNACFPEDLHSHRQYEYALQDCFLHFFPEAPCHGFSCGSIMDTIRAYHQDYARISGDVQTDCSYTILVCSTILYQLFPKNTYSAA